MHMLLNSKGLYEIMGKIRNSARLTRSLSHKSHVPLRQNDLMFLKERHKKPESTGLNLKHQLLVIRICHRHNEEFVIQANFCGRYVSQQKKEIVIHLIYQCRLKSIPNYRFVRYFSYQFYNTHRVFARNLLKLSRRRIMFF